MPIYSFVSGKGDVIDKIVPKGTESVNIEGIKYKRSIVSEGFSIGGSAAVPSQADQVMRGYQKLEKEEGSRFLKRSQFTTKQIKKAWGF